MACYKDAACIRTGRELCSAQCNTVDTTSMADEMRSILLVGAPGSIVRQTQTYPRDLWRSGHPCER